MLHDPAKTPIYHITHVANLPDIIAADGLHSDAIMATRKPKVIGYEHIKARRLKVNRVTCCANRFVGEFVPFYYCPRSPMLFTINKGSTGLPAGCQKDIVHLVSNVAVAIALGQPWAICKINAAAGYVDASSFSTDVTALDELNWNAIRATYWSEVVTQKSAEFLVADSFPWSAIQGIVCQNSVTAAKVGAILTGAKHQPPIEVKTGWYY